MEYILSNGEKYNIREARPDQWDNAMELAFRIFLRYEAKDYGKEGTEEFASFVTDPRLKSMFELGSYRLLLAVKGEEIIGLISRRSGNHISLLFVDDRYHRNGVGSALMYELIEDTRENSTYRNLTVNAAPYGTEFYHKLGFIDTGASTQASGMIYTPMVYFFH